jgi:hypothetical protein
MQFENISSDKKIELVTEVLMTVLEEFPNDDDALDRDDKLVVLCSVIGMQLAMYVQEPDDEFYRIVRRAVDLSYRLHVRVFAETTAHGRA